MADTRAKLLALRPKHPLSSYPDVLKKLATFTHARVAEGIFVVHAAETPQQLCAAFAAMLHPEDSVCVFSAATPCAHSGSDEEFHRLAELIV